MYVEMYTDIHTYVRMVAPPLYLSCAPSPAAPPPAPGPAARGRSTPPPAAACPSRGTPRAPSAARPNGKPQGGERTETGHTCTGCEAMPLFFVAYAPHAWAYFVKFPIGVNVSDLFSGMVEGVRPTPIHEEVDPHPPTTHSAQGFPIVQSPQSTAPGPDFQTSTDSQVSVFPQVTIFCQSFSCAVLWWRGGRCLFKSSQHLLRVVGGGLLASLDLASGNLSGKIF